MPQRLFRYGPLFALLAMLAGCATRPATSTALPPLPTHANGQVLWTLVHDQCVPHQRGNIAPPVPCAEVAIDDGEDGGFAVLKDRVGVAQYLVMPTAPITGIEDPRVLAPGAPNLFARAWEARGLLIRQLG